MGPALLVLCCMAVCGKSALSTFRKHVSSTCPGLFKLCYMVLCAVSTLPKHISLASWMRASLINWTHLPCLVTQLKVDGVMEAFFFMDQDLPQNSSLQCTLLAHILNITADTLSKKAVDMPSVLRVHSDNASGERKNQVMLLMGGFLARASINCACVHFGNLFRLVLPNL